MDNEKGVWRTVRGRRIFIRSDESLGSAMARSGKFKRADIRETRENKRFVDSKAKFLSENNSNKAQKYKNKLDRYDTNAIKNRGAEQDEKNKTYEYAPTHYDAKTRTDRNFERYSKEQQRELQHEELQKKLTDYKANTLQDAEESLKSWRIYRDRNQKSLDRAKNPESKKRFLNEVQDANKEIQKAKETIDNFKAKKQSNNKIDNKQFEVSELKQKALERLPKEDIDTHDSDLYIKKTKESEALISNMKDKDSGLLTTFKDQNTGETWYDIPFGNMSDDFKEKQSNNKIEENEIVNDDNQAISYSFRTNKRDMFTIRYNRVGNNKNMDFATTASTFNRNRTDYERAGQAQKDVLKEGTKAREFYDKWDKKHLGTLTQKEYKELVNDIEDLKKEYPYIQGDRFYDQVELDRSTKDKKSKIEAYKKRKGK